MRRESILVRDAADINRVRIRVATRWTLPHIQISTDRFPKLAAQYAQDHFTRLSDACNCLLGEVLGGTTLLGGTFAAWVFTQRWRDVGMTLFAALVVLLVGKTIEMAWTRVRMLLVLRGLRRRLDSSQDLRATKLVAHTWLESGHHPHLSSSTEVAGDIAIPHSRLPRAPRRRVLLHNVADINRLQLHLATRWRLPRIDIRVDGLPVLEAQRAQHRYMRLADGANFMPAGVLAALTLLGGLLYVLLKQAPDASPIERPELWMTTLGWGDVQPVVIAMLCAALLGWVIEIVVIRVRLLRLLRRLRRQITAQLSKT